MLKHLITFSFAAVSLLAAAQVEWIGKEYNFGTWSENEGLREGHTVIVNHTDKPVLIRRVRPSCGCTGVDWPKDPVAPGDSARIVFNYNPQGRPGPFDKTIKVYLDDNTTPDIISIKGTVIGDDSSLIHRYPHSVGPLRFGALSYDFGNVTFGEMRHAFIPIYNTAPGPVTPELSALEVPEGALPVEFAFTPATVDAGNIQTLSLYLNTRTAGIGKNTRVQTICVDGTCVDFTVTANILPPAASLTPEQLAAAPQCDARPDVVEAGKIKRGKTKEVEFTITNPGKSRLNVARVYSTRPEVRIKGWPMYLEAGKKGRVKVEIVTSAETPDVISDVIEIISDDPVKPISAVRVVATVK